jgi:hypothetical protein
MALSTDLSRVTGDTRAKVLELQARAANELGLDLRIRSSRRTCAEQAEQYAIGRQPGDTRAIVTRAMGCRSWHVLGRAVDFNIYYVATGKLSYIRSDQEKMGKLAQSMGFIWGGDGSFGFDDPSHVEYHPGITNAQACPDPYACRDDVVDESDLPTEQLASVSGGVGIGLFALALVLTVGGVLLYRKKL